MHGVTQAVPITSKGCHFALESCAWQNCKAPAGHGQAKAFVGGLPEMKQWSPIFPNGSAGRTPPVNLLPATSSHLSCCHALALAGNDPSIWLKGTAKTARSVNAPIEAGSVPFSPDLARWLR